MESRFSDSESEYESDSGALVGGILNWSNRQSNAVRRSVIQRCSRTSKAGSALSYANPVAAGVPKACSSMTPWSCAKSNEEVGNCKQIRQMLKSRRAKHIHEASLHDAGSTTSEFQEKKAKNRQGMEPHVSSVLAVSRNGQRMARFPNGRVKYLAGPSEHQPPRVLCHPEAEKWVRNAYRTGLLDPPKNYGANRPNLNEANDVDGYVKVIGECLGDEEEIQTANGVSNARCTYHPSGAESSLTKAKPAGQNESSLLEFPHLPPPLAEVLKISLAQRVEAAMSRPRLDGLHTMVEGDVPAAGCRLKTKAEMCNMLVAGMENRQRRSIDKAVRLTTISEKSSVHSLRPSSWDYAMKDLPFLLSSSDESQNSGRDSALEKAETFPPAAASNCEGSARELTGLGGLSSQFSVTTSEEVKDGAAEYGSSPTDSGFCSSVAGREQYEEIAASENSEDSKRSNGHDRASDSPTDSGLAEPASDIDNSSPSSRHAYANIQSSILRSVLDTRHCFLLHVGEIKDMGSADNGVSQACAKRAGARATANCTADGDGGGMVKPDVRASDEWWENCKNPDNTRRVRTRVPRRDRRIVKSSSSEMLCHLKAVRREVFVTARWYADAVSLDSASMACERSKGKDARQGPRPPSPGAVDGAPKGTGSPRLPEKPPRRRADFTDRNAAGAWPTRVAVPANVAHSQRNSSKVGLRQSTSTPSQLPISRQRWSKSPLRPATVPPGIIPV